jgi:CheY-like chemotaxis protein
MSTGERILEADPQHRKKRLMIVDDDLDILPLYEMIGDIPDTILTIQTGGFSALKTLDALNYQVDAVICDLSMPDLDGLSLTQLIRRNEEIRSVQHPMEIFWFTGYPINSTLETAKTTYRVREVFVKPTTPDVMVDKVREYLK